MLCISLAVSYTTVYIIDSFYIYALIIKHVLSFWLFFCIDHASTHLFNLCGILFLISKAYVGYIPFSILCVDKKALNVFSIFNKAKCISVSCLSWF